jgi:hypothetical protein
MTASPTISEYPSLLSSGHSLRKPTAGPEYDLVKEYVKGYLPAPTREQSLTVFLEPSIESGSPDIVAVYWHAAIAERWSANRLQMSKYDIRVLHYLAVYGQSDVKQLRTLFPKKILTVLDRLYEADLVLKKSGVWKAKSLNKIFAVRRLIAIEAKITHWQKGLSQAFQNTWFASESYLLLPHIPKRAPIREKATCLGVGVVVHNQLLCSTEISARRDQIPKSYASWLFNEWAWGASIASPNHHAES